MRSQHQRVECAQNNLVTASDIRIPVITASYSGPPALSGEDQGRGRAAVQLDLQGLLPGAPTPRSRHLNFQLQDWLDTAANIRLHDTADCCASFCGGAARSTPDVMRILHAGELVATHPVLEGRRQYR